MLLVQCKMETQNALSLLYLLCKVPSDFSVDEVGESQDPEAAKDGLAHVFLARDSSPVPETLVQLEISFFVFEVPKTFMAGIGQMCDLPFS